MSYVLTSLSGNLISAASAGFAPTNSADVSAIASAYAESAVSSKADSSALSSYVPYSSLEYNTASAISGINGSALAAGSTYSAGEGIDITDDVISVEAPVDIVAGPGISIDNPDGNTLRVSQQYPTDETVLWTGDTGMIIGSSSGSCSLSESAFNFEKIGIYAQGSVVACIELHCFEIGTSPMTFGLVVSQYESNETIFNDACVIGLSGATLSYSNGSRTELKTTIAHRNDRGPKIVKIVGIHRINGGN